jgi:hypothetical protein
MSSAGNRDAGLFVALPHAVINSAAYRGLSHTARSLLIDIAMQLSPRGENNGQLLCSRNYLAALGWKSSDTVQRAKDDLIKAGLIFETVKGQRPNRASWYAVTWMAIQRHPGYDAGAWADFRRSAYMDADARANLAIAPAKPDRESLFRKWDVAPKGGKSAGAKNAPLIPSHGTGAVSAVPSHGAVSTSIAPSDGTVTPVFGASPVPSDGHLSDVFHLEDLPTGLCLDMAGGDWVLTTPSSDTSTANGSTGLELLH